MQLSETSEKFEIESQKFLINLMHFSSSASAGFQNKMSSELFIHVIFKNRQVSCYHRVDGIVGKICWYLMGRSHAILNVIIGGGWVRGGADSPTLQSR